MLRIGAPMPRLPDWLGAPPGGCATHSRARACGGGLRNLAAALCLRAAPAWTIVLIGGRYPVKVYSSCVSMCMRCLLGVAVCSMHASVVKVREASSELCPMYSMRMGPECAHMMLPVLLSEATYLMHLSKAGKHCSTLQHSLLGGVKKPPSRFVPAQLKPSCRAMRRFLAGRRGRAGGAALASGAKDTRFCNACCCEPCAWGMSCACGSIVHQMF